MASKVANLFFSKLTQTDFLEVKNWHVITFSFSEVEPKDTVIFVVVLEISALKK